MGTTTVQEKFDDLAEAEQLYRSFAGELRIFVSYLRDDNDHLYDVKPMPVETLKDPNFRFAHEWFGTNKDEVVKKVHEYNNRLRRNGRCYTAQRLFMAISDVIRGDNQERKEQVKALASHLRGRRGVRCQSNLGWLLWRIWRIHEWDDHVGLADLIDRMDLISGAIVTGATGAKRQKWSNLLENELAQR